MIVGVSQSIKNRGRVRVLSPTIDVLSRHLKHVTIDDLPTLAEVLDAVRGNTTVRI